MRAIVHCFLCVGLLLGWVAAGAAAAKKPRAAVKKSAAKSSAEAPAKSAKKASAGKAGVKSAKSTKRPARRRSTTARRRVHRPVGQARPAPERFAEIQRALKQRGYYEGEADGKWDDESTAALKRFQADQNLRQDGKIGSLSLIALGLGPKRGGAAAPPPPQGVPTATPGAPTNTPAPDVELPIPVPSEKAPK